MSCNKYGWNNALETAYFNGLDAVISRVKYQAGSNSSIMSWGKVGAIYSFAGAGGAYLSGDIQTGNEN